MKYWLVKSEPETWSWNDHKKAKVEMWDGVRNYQARNNLKNMQKGDLCFFYHSVKEKKIIGIIEVVKEHYADPTDNTGRFVVVDFKIKNSLKKSVSLEEIKKHKTLQHLPLIKQSRLSVMPIDKKSWNKIIDISLKK
tara:strand:+ start:378 stop:788 length:411 start_codon:yes stop_codon:yes gene_type:complete